MVDQCLQIPKCNYYSGSSVIQTPPAFDCEEMPSAFHQVKEVYESYDLGRTYATTEGYQAAKALVNQAVGMVSCKFWFDFSCSPVEGSQHYTEVSMWNALQELADARHFMRSNGNGHPLDRPILITTGDVQWLRSALIAANDSSWDNSANTTMCFNQNEVTLARASIDVIRATFPTPPVCAWDNCQKALRCEDAKGHVTTEK